VVIVDDLGDTVDELLTDLCNGVGHVKSEPTTS